MSECQWLILADTSNTPGWVNQFVNTTEPPYQPYTTYLVCGSLLQIPNLYPNKPIQLGHSSAQDAITKCPRWSSLNERNLLFHSSGARCSRSRWELRKFLIRPLFMACRELPSLCVSMWQGQGFGVSSSSYMGTNPIRGLYPHCVI